MVTVKEASSAEPSGEGTYVNVLWRIRFIHYPQAATHRLIDILAIILTAATLGAHNVRSYAFFDAVMYSAGETYDVVRRGTRRVLLAKPPVMRMAM